MHHMTESNKKRLTSYVKINGKLRRNIELQNKVKKEIRDIRKKMTNVENDIRFYKNMLK